MKKIKPLPKFKNEKEERKFWEKNDTTEYFDVETPLKLNFPNLRPTTKSITIRLPVSMLYDLKIMANKKDIPYQSMMKMFLSERITREKNLKVRT